MTETRLPYKTKSTKRTKLKKHVDSSYDLGLRADLARSAGEQADTLVLGTKLSKKPKFAHGGPRANSGGPRTPGPGKVLGRPKKFSAAMAYKGIRVPPEWIPLLLAHGDGDFAEGVRRVLQASGVVDAA